MFLLRLTSIVSFWTVLDLRCEVSSFAIVADKKSSRALSMSTTDEEKKAAPELSNSIGKSALSMNITELSEVLGGTGRAKIVWDFFKLGLDPELFFGSNCGLTKEERDDIVAMLPIRRQNEVLGKSAINALQSANGDGGIEMGIATLSSVHTSNDGTTKLLMKLNDGLEVETVIIPWDDRKRSTLCISSQVGCRQGCTFCATGRMGRLRNLSSDEILIQMYYANKICRVSEIYAIDNIVFMGMGEPSDNPVAVKKACEILTDRQLFQLAQSKVTVSTVAPAPESFSLFEDTPCSLAWSVHAATDELRKKLVPTTKYTMKELQMGLVDTLKKRTKKLRTMMLEYVLIDGVNDRPEDAEALGDFTQEIIDLVPNSKIMINLIRFNDIGHATFQRPQEENVLEFQNRLLKKNITAFIRITRGDDESAACGQLATKKLKI